LWADVPEPKAPGFPEADEKLGGLDAAYGAGALLNDPTPGLYTVPTSVEECVNSE